LTCDVADAAHDALPTWNMGGDGVDGAAGAGGGSAGSGQPGPRGTRCGGGLTALVVVVDVLVNSSNSTLLEKLTRSWPPTSAGRHALEVPPPPPPPPQEVKDRGGVDARGAIPIGSGASYCGRTVYPLRADDIEDRRSVLCDVADAKLRHGGDGDVMEFLPELPPSVTSLTFEHAPVTSPYDRA